MPHPPRRISFEGLRALGGEEPESRHPPRTPDAEAAMRIAIVRELTEAAQAEAIGWEVRDRRLRALFDVREGSRAFDSRRPLYDH